MTGIGCFVLVLQFPWKLGDLMARNIKDQRKGVGNTLLQWSK